MHTTYCSFLPYLFFHTPPGPRLLPPPQITGQPVTSTGMSSISRYSRIFLRPKGSWTAESSSKISTSAGPASTSSPGFSYPPSSPFSQDPDSPFPMTSPLPHPYTIGAALGSPIETSSREGTSTTHHAQYPTHTTTNTSDYHDVREKPPDSAGIGHRYPRTAIPLPSNDTQRPSPPLPLLMRPFVLLVLFLPIPPLLSLIYMVVGHAILRASKEASPGSIFHSPLLSSIEAGATGGVILALPIALLLYILLLPSKPANAPEDFFDDDTSSMLGQAKWLRYLSYLVCPILVLGIGGFAGPLGVTCLSSGTLNMFVGTKKMLSTGAAAAAGFVGGVLMAGGVFTVGIIAMAIWSFCIRQKPPPTI